MLIWRDFVVRLKPLLMHLSIGAAVIVMHPDLLVLDVKSGVMLACYVLLAFNNSAVSKYKERS